MKSFLKLMKSHIWLVIFTMLTSALAVTASFIWNREIANLINAITAGNTPDKSNLIWMVITLLFVALFEALYALCAGYTGEKISETLRFRFARKLQQKSVKELSELNAGTQVSMLLNEVEEISHYITEDLFPLLNNFMKCVVTFSFLSTLNFPLTFLSNIPALLIMVYACFTSKILGGLAIMSQKARQETNGITDTILELFPVMKLFHAEGVMLKRYSQVTNHWVEVTSKEEKRRSLLLSLSAILSCLPTLVLVYLGGTFILQGKMNIGTLYLFISMSANVTGFFMNMSGFIATFRRFISNFKSMQMEDETWVS